MRPSASPARFSRLGHASPLKRRPAAAPVCLEMPILVSPYAVWHVDAVRMAAGTTFNVPDRCSSSISSRCLRVMRATEASAAGRAPQRQHYRRTAAHGIRVASGPVLASMDAQAHWINYFVVRSGCPGGWRARDARGSSRLLGAPTEDAATDHMRWLLVRKPPVAAATSVSGKDALRRLPEPLSVASPRQPKTPVVDQCATFHSQLRGPTPLSRVSALPGAPRWPTENPRFELHLTRLPTWWGTDAATGRVFGENASGGIPAKPTDPSGMVTQTGGSQGTAAGNSKRQPIRAAATATRAFLGSSVLDAHSLREGLAPPGPCRRFGCWVATRLALLAPA